MADPGVDLADPGVEMAASSSPKVVLKNTTRMSLNERFTEILTSKQPMQVTMQATEQATQEPQQQAQPPPSDVSSSEAAGPESGQTPENTGNQKLVQQMGSRPSGRAALTLKADRITQGLGKRSVHSRLGWPMGSGARRAVGRWGGSSTGGGSRGGSSGGGGGGLSRAAGDGGEMQGEWVFRSRQQKSRGRLFPQYQDTPYRRYASPQMSVRRGGARRGLGWEESTGYGGVTTGGQRGYSYRRREFFGGRGRRRSHVASQPVPTKEQLDDQLDAYMAENRETLDTELDTYMAQINEESND